MNFDLNLETVLSVSGFVVALLAAAGQCIATWVTWRPAVSLYVVATKSFMYVKVRNFGGSVAYIDSFSTNVDVDDYKSKVGRDFPYVGLQNYQLVQGQSNIGVIDNAYLNRDNWLEVRYRSRLGIPYKFRANLVSPNRFALVGENDFDLLDR